MNENRQSLFTIASSFGAVIGGISGLISIAIVVFSGGALVERVKNIDTRLVDIEVHAAPITREHIRMEETLHSGIEKRLSTLEEMKAAVLEIKGKLGENSIKMDAMRESQQRLETQVERIQQKEDRK